MAVSLSKRSVLCYKDSAGVREARNGIFAVTKQGGHEMKTKNDILIAGHRGYPARYPENTLRSFEEAIRCGCDMVETDVRASKDGVLVIMHDESALRTTGVDKNISDMTLEEIKGLYVGDPELGQQVPTLKEFLELCAPYEELLLDIEIKSDRDEVHARSLVDGTVALCREYGICDRVMINSFDFYVLKYFRNTYGKMFVTHGYYPYTHMKHVDTDPIRYLDYACFWASGEQARKACDFLLKNGVKPCTGSRTTAEAFRELSAYGCAMFTENDPEPFLALRKSLK